MGKGKEFVYGGKLAGGESMQRMRFFFFLLSIAYGRNTEPILYFLDLR
jgi:hypothetical protein